MTKEEIINVEMSKKKINKQEMNEEEMKKLVEAVGHSISNMEKK